MKRKTAERERRGEESRGEERRGEQRRAEGLIKQTRKSCNIQPDTSLERDREDRRFCSSRAPRSRQGARTISLLQKHPAPNLTVRSGKKRAALWGRPWLVSGCS